MADREQAAGESAAAATAAAKAAVTAITDLLDQLVPPEDVEIVDVYGGRHRLRARLPARAQVLVLRHLEAVFSADVGEDLRQTLQTRGYGAALALVARAAANEDVLAGLARAFAAAHPSALAEARSRAVDQPVTDAADLFGVEEMAAALLPFFLAPLRRMAGVLREMLATPPAR